MRVFRIAPAVVATAVVLSTGCTPEVDLVEARLALVAADGAYVDAMDRGDVEAIVALYADDATRYPPDGDPSGGPGAMRAFAEGIAGTAGFGVEAWPARLQVSADGDWGYTLSHLRVTWASDDGAPVVQWMRDAHVWRRAEDGRWRIVEDIWHVMEAAPSVASILSAPGVVVKSLGMVDLLGEPLDFDPDADAPLPSATPGGALLPVEVFTVWWDGGDQGGSLRLVLAGFTDVGPDILLDHPIQLQNASGWGYANTGPVMLEADRDGEPLKVVVDQAEYPGDDAGGVMPGAPVLLEWTMVDGRYAPAGG